MTESDATMRLLAAIVDSSSDAIISQTLAGAITSWNPAAEAMYGYTRDEAVGQSIDLIVPSDRRDELEQIDAALARGERVGEFETVRRRKSGERISVRLTMSPINDERGEVVGVSAITRSITLEMRTAGEVREDADLARGVALVGQQRDVTARRDAEEKLRMSEDLYRLVVENSRDLISLVDRGGRFLFASSAYRRILGYEPAVLVGTSASELIHPDDRSGAERWFEEPADAPVALRLRHADGSFVAVETNAGLVGLGAAKPVGILAVSRDITERIRTSELEERLRRGEKLEAIGRLAGGLAHDFNNLLTIIGGFEAIALEHRAEPDRVREALGHIRRAADDGAKLTRQLLAFGRQQVLRPEVIDLNQIISDYEPMLDQLLGDDVEVRFDLAPDLGRIRADKGQVGQIVVNLAVNARDAMPGGGKVTIQTAEAELGTHAVDSDTAPGAFVRLIVTDTGIGIEPERMQRLFEPFFTTKDKGHGLGLATVFGIVKQSGGQISVSSKPARGSSFVVDFPRVEGAPELPPEQEEAVAPVGTARVLLVEDNDVVRNLMRTILAEHGYDVVASGLPREALTLGDRVEEPFDLLVTDLSMPGLGGRELADRLRETWPELKVLFTSGYTDDAMVAGGLLSKGSRFLQKPFTSGELARAVYDVLRA